MKKIYARLVLAILLPLTLSSQITITDTDFANAGDTIRMSQAVWNPFLDFGVTGANHTWDFSNLQWESQYIDSFLNPIFTHPFYSFTFSNLPINPYRSNIAKRESNTLTSIPIISTIFTESINFYYKSTTLYRQRGFGMKVSGFPTSIPMAHADTIYRFPIQYGNRDSSKSDYAVTIPQLGSYVHKQQRFNEVDGWGTLTTPFGTFDALRVRTEIRGSDSLFIDTLNFGFKLDNDIQREYKWFAHNKKTPLLQIYTQAGILGQFQGFEFVTKIIYRDSVRFLPTGILDPSSNEIQCRVYPNPSSGLFYIAVPETLGKAMVSLTDLSGKLLLNRELNAPMDAIDGSTYAKGVYILTIQANEGRAAKKIVIE